MNENERRLAQAVDKILASYSQHGNINYFDGENLPTRSEVDELLNDLMAVIFPGYFTRERLDDLTARYFVGERCARSLRRLERLVNRAFRVRTNKQHLFSCKQSQYAQTAHECAVELIQAIPSIREILAEDVQAALIGDPAACSSSEVIMSYPGITAITVHRIAHYLYQRKIPLLPRMMSELVHGRTGIDIHPGATIGNRFFIDHGTGVVIGETCVIGNHVKIYQGVTLGALSVDPKLTNAEDRNVRKRHPSIEDHVTIYAGATILGGDTVIGRGSTIGGNVWLTRSVPPSTTVVWDVPSLRYLASNKQISMQDSAALRDPKNS